MSCRANVDEFNNKLRSLNSPVARIDAVHRGGIEAHPYHCQEVMLIVQEIILEEISVRLLFLMQSQWNLSIILALLILTKDGNQLHLLDIPGREKKKPLLPLANPCRRSRYMKKEFAVGSWVCALKK
jgi:hypothetical protein